MALDAVADVACLAHYRLFGFFLGSTLAGTAVYYYVLQEYKTSNELLTGDIYVRLHPLPLCLTGLDGLQALH